MSAAPARSVYELQLIYPDDAKRRAQEAKSVAADVVVGGLLGLLASSTETSTAGLLVAVTVEIVDLRTRETVMTMALRVEEAQGVIDLINADLDRLDPDGFADEWGITAST